MKGIIKKGDIVIFICILVLSAFFIFGLASKIKNNDTEIIEVIYSSHSNKETLLSVDINTDATYIIKTNEDLNKLQVFLNYTCIKEIDYDNDKEIYNSFKVINKSVKMIDANCKNKDCMKITINSKNNLPIICTNGITIKFKTNNSEVDVIS